MGEQDMPEQRREIGFTGLLTATPLVKDLAYAQIQRMPQGRMVFSPYVVEQVLKRWKTWKSRDR
jgi:hypothetical protein